LIFRTSLATYEASLSLQESPDLALTLTFLLLLILSSFFSGSETAYFSLDRAATQRISDQNGRAAELVLGLISRPRELLIAVLFGNVLVNVAYFSLAASFATRLGSRGPSLELAAHAGALALIIVAGEVVPKTITIQRPEAMALLAARPLWIWVRASRLVTEPLSSLTGRFINRLERRFPPPGAMSNVELAQLVTLQAQEGVLNPSLGDLLQDVLLLSHVRVREIMTPRVDIGAFDLTKSRASYLELAARLRRTKICVHSGGGLDDIHGVVNLKRVLAEPERGLAELVEPLWFIPETKEIESLLQEFLRRDASVALVVDEYGGTSGLVTMEDVVEEIVGDISQPSEVPAFEVRGPSRVFLSGDLAIREMNELLDLGLPTEGATTVAGFLAKELGRIPRPDDEVEVDAGRLRVIRVEKFRTRQVEVTLKAPRGLGRLLP